jgi:hypothetical protein
MIGHLESVKESFSADLEILEFPSVDERTTEKQQVVVFRLLNPGGSSAVLRGLDTEARARASPLKQSKARKGFCFLFPDSLPHNVTHPPSSLPNHGGYCTAILSTAAMKVLKYSISHRLVSGTISSSSSTLCRSCTIFRRLVSLAISSSSSTLCRSYLLWLLSSLLLRFFRARLRSLSSSLLSSPSSSSSLVLLVLLNLLILLDLLIPSQPPHPSRPPHPFSNSSLVLLDLLPRPACPCSRPLLSLSSSLTSTCDSYLASLVL